MTLIEHERATTPTTGTAHHSAPAGIVATPAETPLSGSAPAHPRPDLDHERVLVVTGRRSGLVIVVAVHSTRLGQALGGCRFWHYDSWTDGLDDALRLSRAMTLKNATAGLARGGGKAVIVIPTGTVLTEEGRQAAMLDLGDAVESLDGAYMTAEDVGTSAPLMAIVALRTRHVCGLPAEQGGVGEPADATATGVHAAVRATLDSLFGSAEVNGRHIVISGLGQVGSRLARALVESGARLTVTDIDPAKRRLADELGARWSEPAAALTTPADLLVPCGLGGVVTDQVIDRLRVAGVVGAANNQLANRSGARRLADRGILWAPDFIANAGGVIYLDGASGSDPASAEQIAERLEGIGETLTGIFAAAKQGGTTTLEEAERLARERLAAHPASASPSADS
ncbi:Glu/Leu/Phe/Val dehydrogenase dimerization domain-containing protein [Rathayibacter sp. YIM 133350]|uniref:Glu/Leu/Phe/Val dehydrogenase family protein n=1 Tax=Rathayibacter sp. YIM 133350 TaxID=3131992 RepID=UPI00307DEF19